MHSKLSAVIATHSKIRAESRWCTIFGWKLVFFFAAMLAPTLNALIPEINPNQNYEIPFGHFFLGCGYFAG